MSLHYLEVSLTGIYVWAYIITLLTFKLDSDITLFILFIADFRTARMLLNY